MTQFIVLDLPASYKMLGVLRACIAETLSTVPNLAEGDTITYNVQLSAQEIAVNIIEHSYGGETNDKRFSVTVSLTDEPRAIIIDMRDTGNPFDPGAIPAPDLNEAHEGGYGLFIAQQLMDKVQYTAAADHNEWLMEKKLPW